MRRKIVDAAIQMFVEEGYDKMSIRKIADKIEYSPATIYLYYKDKDELLYDVQSEGFDALAEHFRKAVTEKDPYRRLKQMAWAYVNFYRENPQLYDLMFIINDPMNAEEDEEDWKNGDNAYDALQQLMQECIDNKLVRFKNAVVASISVWGFLHGLISLDLRCRIKVCKLSGSDLEEGMEDAINEYLRIIKA